MPRPVIPLGQLRARRGLPALVLVVALVLAACGTGDDGDGDAATTTTTAAPTTTTTSLPDPASPPERWVGIDDDGRLVSVRTDDGEVEAVLGTFDHPEECPPPGEPVAGCNWVIDVTVDGRDVYYETCCEPAPGTIFRVPATGGAPEMVAHGGHPAIDPGGERLAAVEMQWVAVHRLDGDGEPQRFESTGGADVAALHGMSWSPDGERLAFTVFHQIDRAGVLHVLDVEGASGLEDARRVEADGDASWMYPAFRADGLVAVAEQEVELPDRHRGPARLLLVDPDSGEVEESFEPGGAVRSLSYDRSGQRLIYVTDDGSVRWRDADGAESVLADGGYLAAAW